jgi:hypothetical protein
MAVGTLGVTLVNDPLAGKVQYTALKPAIEWGVPEMEWYDDFQESDIIIGPTTLNMPLDLEQGFGAASLADGGREARAVSPTIRTAQLTLTHINARFSVTRWSKAMNQQSRAAYVTNEMTFKARKRLEAIQHKVGLNFYGFTSGQVCQVSAAVSGVTAGAAITFSNAFGDTNLTNTLYINQLFNVGDQIGILSSASGTLLAGGVGEITAKGTSNVYTVAFSSALTIAANSSVMFANNAAYGDTFTETAHTDFNKWQPGLKDMTESTSLHSLSGTTYPGWTSAVTDSTGGRFTPLKLKKIRQLMQNAGKKLKGLVIAQGVERDMEDQMNASVRFMGIDAIQFDGSAKTKEKQMSSRYTPGGHVFGIADGVLKKKVLGAMPDQSQGEMDKLENYARYVLGDDLMWVVACESRKGLAEYRGLTEQ